MFDNFDTIVQDINAKSLSFNMIDEISVLDESILNELKSIGEKHSKALRISLHGSPLEKLHNMVIYSNDKDSINIHCHKDKEETYHIIDGKLMVIFFSNTGAIVKKIVLSKEGNLICRIPKKQYHVSIVVSGYAIYHESRIGPFICTDSIVPSWCSDFTREFLLNEDIK